MKKTFSFFLFLSLFLGHSQTKEIDSLFIELAFQKQDSTKVLPYLHLVKSLYAIGKYDRAIKYIQASEKLSLSFNYKKGIAETNYYKALYYVQKDDYINAINSFSKANDFYNQQKNTLGIAHVNNHLGIIETKRGNYKKGLEYSLAAINTLQYFDQKQELSLAYNNLAKTYFSTGLENKAIEFNLKALDLQEQLSDTTAIHSTSKRLANLYYEKHDHYNAIEYFEKVLKYNGHSDSLQSSVYPKLGGEYLALKQYEPATQYLIKGYNINRKTNNKPNLLIALNNLGDLNLQKNRLRTAQKQLLEAGEIAKEIDNKTELLRQYYLMKVVDSTQRNFHNAFIWQSKYYQLKSSLSKVKTPEKKESKLPFSVALESKISPSEINHLPKTENKPQTTSKLKFDNINTFSFYALLLALLIMTSILFVINSKRNKALKKLEDLKEKNITLEVENAAFVEETKNLENVINVKDKLFSIISHDLKDSLSSINGFIDLLKDGSLSREEFDSLIPELSDNANNASLLLFNLLNWSKSQMQSLDPKATLFDIQEVFIDKVNLIEQRMETKGITLINNSLRSFIFADRSMFEIVIQNLLANALKFCNNGDIVSISNQISRGHCIISISDTGIGISKENIDKLFTNSSFTTSGTNNEKGTGLGLSICKELVELNHGKIWVESMPDVGTTFHIELPKSQPAPVIPTV
ncbi:tetratricopeptide repeat-containing sensor histidine kinase [Algibacter miyuki]|uniref:histidine kinase n=1 Tax=Algibacter miyuki TaxID=1306933 RepID=A0ABV5H169_9FLAO|nr:tetratricopeptide repeat-containing sensor histidine kinase [Algibacter miyuki]MDN3666260.1 tetratricopeptide repeat-containing sensor histidine kinase [Algibacter miyuki]